MSAGISFIHGIGMTSLRTRQRLVWRLRARGISHEAVLEVILNTPRHLFVEEALASRAYEDIALPIGFGQTISQPYIVARMTQALLEDRSPQKILEVGTGSAYQTAVLSRLAAQIYSIERIGKLLERGRGRLRALGLSNIRLRHGDGSMGWPENAPYDGIIVTAAPTEVPAGLLEQLAPGGRLIAPVGFPAAQELVLIERSVGGLTRQVLGPVSFVPLVEDIL